MLAQGATTTMEVWSTRDKPNLSWSHPWCSAPANAVPRLLMGVTPITPDFQRFSVMPQLGNLTHASLSLPTKHGRIDLRVDQTIASVTVSLTVPVGCVARVCLPATGVGSPQLSSASALVVDGVTVVAVVKGRMLCAPQDLAAGMHTVVRQ